jgi:hypothetical protein
LEDLNMVYVVRVKEHRFGLLLSQRAAEIILVFRKELVS